MNEQTAKIAAKLYEQIENTKASIASFAPIEYGGESVNPKVSVHIVNINRQSIIELDSEQVAVVIGWQEEKLDGLLKELSKL